AERAAIRLRRRQRREQRVLCRAARSAGHPRRCAQDTRLPDRGRGTDRRRRDSCDYVAAYREIPAPAFVVCGRTARELRDARKPVADALDQAKRAGGAAERMRDEARQYGRRHLVAGIAEEARKADTTDAGREPAPTLWFRGLFDGAGYAR